MSLWGFSLMAEQMMRDGKGFAQSISEINSAREKAGMRPLNAKEIEEFADAARKEWEKIPWEKIDKSLGPSPELNSPEDHARFKRRQEIANERVYRSLKGARARFMPPASATKAARMADDAARVVDDVGKWLTKGSRGAEAVGLGGLAAMEALRRRKNANIGKMDAEPGPAPSASTLDDYVPNFMQPALGPDDWRATTLRGLAHPGVQVAGLVPDAYNRGARYNEYADRNTVGGASYGTKVMNNLYGFGDAFNDAITLGGYDYVREGPQASPNFSAVVEAITSRMNTGDKVMPPSNYMPAP